ncbi:MAG: restriction endonuclease subunit S [Demequina sp.]|nr:restriction endonuclease subunit S [Demequina sp.]
MAADLTRMRLGDFVELKRGYDLPKQRRSPGNIPVVSSGGVTDFHVEAKVCGPGVVTGRYGTIGEVFYVEGDFWPLNTALYVSDFKGNDPRFVSYFLRTLDFLKYSDKAAVPGVNRNHLHEAIVDVPGVDEQRRIAHILGTLDDKIELNRRTSATLEEMARALFKSWFVDFDPVRAKAEGRDTGLPLLVADLFPDRFDDSEHGETPAGWAAGKVGDVVWCNAHTLGASQLPATVRYLDLGGAKWGSILEVQRLGGEAIPSRARRDLRRGDTVIGTVRPGNGSYARIEEDGLIGSTGFAVLTPKSDSDRDFVYLAATAPRQIDQLEALADGGAYPAVRPQAVSDLPVVVPPEHLRREFARAVSPLLNLVSAATRESAVLRGARDTLLEELIS